MYITYCDKFVQIELAQGSRLLQKVLEYANKHFSKRYQLSSSLLILDDGERFKKDYLINWTYHATMQSVALAHNTQTQKTSQKDSSPKATPKSDEIPQYKAAQNQAPQSEKKSTKAKQPKEAKAKTTKKSKKPTQKAQADKTQKSIADSIPSDFTKADFANFAQEHTSSDLPKPADFATSTQAKIAQATLEENKSANPSTMPTNPTNPRHTDDAELAQILSYSHLPIRIKITNPNTLLKRVKVQIHLSNLGQILVRLPENNRVARRYIRALFGSNILYEVDNEFCISAVGYTESMWEAVMELISSRIIHNIALDFEFNSKKGDSYGGFGESGEGFETFLTREEYLLRKCYSELNVDFRDDFATVKRQYLKLAKKFHPDNAQGKDKGTIEIFEERFKRILDAYNTIKASHAPHTDKTTA